MTKPDRCRDRFERLVLQALQRMDELDPKQAPHCVFTPHEVAKLLRAEHTAVKRLVGREKASAYRGGQLAQIDVCVRLLAKLTARGK
jgi:hypothetical protein